jgi:hypothetical protein
MPGFIVDLAVLGAVLYVGWLGSDRGIFEMAAFGLQLLAAIILGVLLMEPLADLIGSGIESGIGPFLPEWISFEAWAVFLSFALLCWVPFLVLLVNVHPRFAGGGEMKSISTVEKIGGALVGGIDGLLVVGVILITLSLLPFFDGLKVNGNNVHFDVGRTVLHAASGFAGEWHEGRSLAMLGEPASRESVPEARLSSEPRCDSGEGGESSEVARFYDVDENGSFTKDLYYLDVDGSSSRRIGMVEKYVVGRWDGNVVIMDRDRPQPVSQQAPPANQQSEAAPPVRQAPPPQQPAAAQGKPSAVPQPKPTDDSEEEEIVVLVDEDGNVISEEEMAEGNVEIIEEVVEEVVEEVPEEGGDAKKKP